MNSQTDTANHKSNAKNSLSLDLKYKTGCKCGFCCINKTAYQRLHRWIYGRPVDSCWTTSLGFYDIQGNYHFKSELQKLRSVTAPSKKSNRGRM